VSVTPAEPTEIELETAGVAFADVVTLKVNVPEAKGAAALKSTSTVLPALIVQLLASSTERPVTETDPAPPAPAVPDWMQLLPERSSRSTLVGAEAKAAEGVIVTEPSELPDSDVGDVNLTLKLVVAPWPTEAGVTLTLLTAPEGDPIV
jgi:hypothetical protein